MPNTRSAAAIGRGVPYYFLQMVAEEGGGRRRRRTGLESNLTTPHTRYGKNDLT